MTGPGRAGASIARRGSQDLAGQGRAPDRSALPSLADRVIAAMARQKLPPALSYTVAVLIMMDAISVQRGFQLYRAPFLLSLPGIVVITLTFGRGEGVLATAIATFAASTLLMNADGGVEAAGPRLALSILFVVFATFIVLVCDAVRRSALRLSMEVERGRALKTEAEATARALARSEEALRRLAETLEVKVRERTEALEETQAALRQSQKMEALGQLTGGVAHDFNNILAGVVGGLELARARLDQDRVGEAPRYLSIAEDSARRGAALTRRLLAFSRRQAVTLEPLAVGALIAGMEDLIRRTVGPGVSLSVALAEPCGLADADRGQLESAVLNLAINARDAMAGRGRLTLSVGEVAVDAGEARARMIAPGAYVRIAVADTGCGMAPEVAARAFDPFFTTKPVGEGTGLGLSMVYAFARQAGGAAWIETSPGAGTCVVLLLARRSETDPAAPGVDAVAGAAEAAEGRGETILVVEDEDAVRTVVGDALSACGYRALLAADGAAGLAMIDGAPAVDLLIADLGLPGELDGRQVFEAARALRPSLKVLFITGYADAEAASFLEPGMARLDKPFDMESLRRAVAGILWGSSPQPQTSR